jgi:cytosine deaminase
MSDYLVKNCRDRHGNELDIEIINGEIKNVLQKGKGDDSKFSSEDTYNADGNLVSPPLTEPHTHVYGSLSEGRPNKNQKGTLEQAWRTGSYNRKDQSKSQIKDKARKVLNWFASYGITRIRTHLSTSTSPETDTVSEDPTKAAEVMLSLQEEYEGVIDIQLVAIPSKGFARNEELYDNFVSLFDMGIDVVGGMPHREDTREKGVEHTHAALEIADERGLPVDFHIDETDDPNSRYTEVLASKSKDLGIGDRVAASHTTAMHSYPNAYADKLIRLLNESGVSVITNPLSNSVLQGRYDDYPRRRGHTRIDELSEAGVTVAIGQDDISDSANPYGDADILKVLYFLAHFAHMNRIDDAPVLWEMVLHNNAEVFGVNPDDYGLEEGNEGSLVVYDSPTPFDAIRTIAPRNLVINHGNAIAQTKRDSTVLYNDEPQEVDFTHNPDDLNL